MPKTAGVFSTAHVNMIPGRLLGFGVKLRTGLEDEVYLQVTRAGQVLNVSPDSTTF